MTYNVGIVGCGVIGKRLAKTFTGYERTSITGACDLEKQVLDEFVKVYGGEGFLDYQSMVDDLDLDILYVGVPPKFHREIVEYGIDNGLHVICEKPIGINASEGRSMVQAAERTDLVTAVNLPLRYTPAIIRLKQIINNMEAIRKVILRFRFPIWPRSWQDVDWLKTREQGGPLREVGTHFIFTVHELLGDIINVVADVTWTGPGQYEQSISGICQTGSGTPVLVDLECLTNQDEENSLILIGEDKTYKFTNWRELYHVGSSGDMTLITDETSQTTTTLVEEFVTKIEGGSANLVSFEEATSVQAVLDAIFGSEMKSVSVNASTN